MIGVIQKIHIFPSASVLSLNNFMFVPIYKKTRQYIQSILKAFIEALSANFPILKKHDTTMIRVLHIPVPVFVFQEVLKEILTKFLIRIPIGKSADFSNWVFEKRQPAATLGQQLQGTQERLRSKLERTLKHLESFDAYDF